MMRLFVVLQTTLLGFLVALGACGGTGSSGAGASGGTTSGGSGGTGATGASGGTGATGGSGGVGGGSGATGGTGASGGSGGTDGGTGATGGKDGGSGGASDSGVTTTVTGAIVGLVNGLPVTDMQICVYQNPSVPCVKTGSTGDYSLSGVPANQEVLLEYTKTTYLPTLVTVKTIAGPMSVGQFLAPTQAEAATLASLVGITINSAKGHILVTAFQGGAGSFTGQDNVTAAITPKSGAGPYYLNASNIPDQSLTTTSTSGIGLFANVDPGDVDVSLTHFTKTCQRLSTSWVGSKSTASKVKVVAGYLTGGAGLDCP